MHGMPAVSAQLVVTNQKESTALLFAPCSSSAGAPEHQFANPVTFLAEAALTQTSPHCIVCLTSGTGDTCTPRWARCHTAAHFSTAPCFQVCSARWRVSRLQFRPCSSLMLQHCRVPRMAFFARHMRSKATTWSPHGAALLEVAHLSEGGKLGAQPCIPVHFLIVNSNCLRLLLRMRSTPNIFICQLGPSASMNLAKPT